MKLLVNRALISIEGEHREVTAGGDGGGEVVTEAISCHAGHQVLSRCFMRSVRKAGAKGFLPYAESALRLAGGTFQRRPVNSGAVPQAEPDSSVVGQVLHSGRVSSPEIQTGAHGTSTQTPGRYRGSEGLQAGRSLV